MPNQIARIGIVAVAALTLVACVDDQELFAPPTPDSVEVARDFTIEIPGPEDFMAITAGEFHTCALRGNGSVLCWGQEGGPLAIAPLMQTPTLAFSGAIMIDAGAVHTCALDTRREAHCWGGGNQGQLGLGNGKYVTYSSAIAVEGPVNQPQQPLAFNTISAGGFSTCGTAAEGVFCWGEQGNSTNPNTPVASPVQIAAYNGFTSIAVGNRHACGLVFNEALCWGANNFGQSGVDPKSPFVHPGTTLLIFAATTAFGPRVARVATQHDFTCADITNGMILCAGSNSDGQLGIGGAGGFTHLPQKVGRGQQLHGVSTGTAHACALDFRNEAWCWGANNWGQLGNGAANKLMDTPVQVTGRRSYKALAAGRNHTCAIGMDNHVYCWGQNNFRQLGTWIVDVNGNLVTNGHSPNPVLVM